MCHGKSRVESDVGMKNNFEFSVDNVEDKRIQLQAEMQSNSQKLAVKTDQGNVPTIEQMAEKPTDDENGTMLTTSEIIDFAEGTDTYL